MRKSELRRIIREEIVRAKRLNETKTDLDYYNSLDGNAMIPVSYRTSGSSSDEFVVEIPKRELISKSKHFDNYYFDLMKAQRALNKRRIAFLRVWYDFI